MTSCPGHFGHIELVKPVYHVGYFTLCQKLLRCVCFSCSKLLVDRNDPQLINVLARSKHSARKRFDAVYNLCKGKHQCTMKSQEERDQEARGADGDAPNPENEDFRTGCGFNQPRYRRMSPTDIQIEWKKDTTASKLRCCKKLHYYSYSTTTALFVYEGYCSS